MKAFESNANFFEEGRAHSTASGGADVAVDAQKRRLHHPSNQELLKVKTCPEAWPRNRHARPWHVACAPPRAPSPPRSPPRPAHRGPGAPGAQASPQVVLGHDPLCLGRSPPLDSSCSLSRGPCPDPLRTTPPSRFSARHGWRRLSTSLLPSTQHVRYDVLRSQVRCRWSAGQRATCLRV